MESGTTNHGRAYATNVTSVMNPVIGTIFGTKVFSPHIERIGMKKALRSLAIGGVYIRDKSHSLFITQTYISNLKAHNQIKEYSK